MKTDFHTVGGSGVSGDRLISEMKGARLIEEVPTADGQRFMVTSLGNTVYEMFLSREDLGPLIDLLGRGRLRRRDRENP